MAYEHDWDRAADKSSDPGNPYQNNRHSVDKKAEIVRPAASVAMSSLFTGAVYEPQVFTELKKEIAACGRIRTYQEV